MKNEPLSNTTAAALFEWLDLLKMTLPPTWNVQSLIRALLDNFEKIILSEDNLVKVVKQYPPKITTWSESCTHGNDAMGYTCGLWELFHIMTVGLVEWNEQVVTDDGWAFLRTSTSAEVLRNFIANFFNCDVCRANFLNAYDNCAFERCNRLSEDIGTKADWIQFPMWLFETHNAVNIRLMKEKADRENLGPPTAQDERDVQWPPRIDCPKCWNEDGTWDEDVVYHYLRLEYWPTDEESAAIEDRLLETIEVASGDVDDDDWFGVPGFFYWLSGICAFTVLAWFFQDEHSRFKTGRHKKTDVS